jgi:hypothetical protein
VSRAAAIAAILSTLATAPVWAQDAPAMRYVFDNPRLLTQQLLWGQVHGARLLGLACWSRGDTVAALSYVDWLDRQWPPIRTASRDLSRHYFGNDAAPMEAIDAVLNLKPQLEVLPSELAAACDTLSEALAAPRRDLARFYAERREAARRGDGDYFGAAWTDAE